MNLKPQQLYLWRWAVLPMLLPQFVMLIGMTLGGVYQLLYGSSIKTLIWLFLVNSGLGILFFWVGARSIRRLQSKLIEAKGRICIYCKYSLSNIPAPGNCPECGRSYPENSYASYWAKFVSFRSSN